MAANANIQQVMQLVREFPECITSIGGLEFYGVSEEFKNQLRVCRRTVTSGESGSKVYIFLERYHGKTSLTKALEREAKKNGLRGFYLDGTASVTQQRLIEFRNSDDVVVLLDGLPATAANRKVVLDRFGQLTGRGILFSGPEFELDVNLRTEIPIFRLDHIDDRPLDKIA